MDPAFFSVLPGIVWERRCLSLLLLLCTEVTPSAPQVGRRSLQRRSSAGRLRVVIYPAFVVEMASEETPQVPAPAPDQVGTMSSNIVKVNGVEVATDLSKPTIININFNQPSAVHSLLDSAKSVWASRGTSSTVIFKGKQHVVGAMQIMIGLLCVSHAVILCFVGEGGMFWAGSGFWTGFPFILTGAVAIHSERRASCFWRSCAVLMHLVSLAVAIGGMVIISGDLGPYMWSYRGEGAELCKPQRNDYYRRSYETTTPEPYDWRVEQCKAGFNNLLNMFNGMKIVVLMFTSLALILSLYSLAYGIKALCCVCCASKPEEEEATPKDKEPLLTTQPPPYVEKWAKVESI